MGSQGLATRDLPADSRSDRQGAGLAVRRLTLTDFRCYKHQRLEVDARPVVLTGPNGAGKTNLLEGLSFLVPGRGLRRAKLADVIRRNPETDDAPRSSLRPWGVAATVMTPQGDVDIGTGFQAGPPGGRDKRIVRIDGEEAKTQAVLAEHVSAQWLTPLMDRLFLEGAGSRRRFLDRLVFDSDPAHLGRIKAYEHAMRERTRLLSGSKPDGDWLAALEDTMAARGVAVAAARLDLVRRLGVPLAEHADAFPRAAVEVSGDVEGWLAEGPALAAEDRFRDALKRARGRDAKDGRTALGPHRSDLQVQHLENGRPAAICSTGEQKALLVALVLGTARMRAYEQGTAPLLLLDEVTAHLDDIRRDALYDEISALGSQVWLTGTDAGLFGPLAGRAQFFNVADGTVTPQK